MSNDLDDIESRIHDGIYGDDWMSDTARDDAFSALVEIIAEVERLRSEMAELRALGVSLHKSAAMGMDAERAAVVAWLRRRTRSGRRRAFSPAFITDAAAIERGEHRLKERK